MKILQMVSKNDPRRDFAIIGCGLLFQTSYVGHALGSALKGGLIGIALILLCVFIAHLMPKGN